MAEIYSTAEAAEVLGVHPVTLRKWRAKSEFIGCCAVTGHPANEDAQGLQWYYEHQRKIVYYADTVQRLKRILERRKTK